MKAGAMVVVVGLLACVTACEDKAKPSYGECVQAEAKADYLTAETACNAAVAADPNSTSGKAAAAKLKDMQPMIAKTKADKAAADAKAAEEQQKRDDESAKAAAASQAQAMAALRGKIHRTSTTDSEDDNCAGQGKPGHSFRYGGGTYDENESIAYADGCKPYDDTAVSVTGHAQNHFCCP